MSGPGAADDGATRAFEAALGDEMRATSFDRLIPAESAVAARRPVTALAISHRRQGWFVELALDLWDVVRDWTGAGQRRGGRSRRVPHR
jgi:hypothetical protein